jgi:hypothetical protein
VGSRWLPWAPATTVLAVVLLAISVLPQRAIASGPPPALPIGAGNHVVGGLEAPVLSPGTSGTIQLVLADPLTAPVSAVVVGIEVYAFNAYPGNSSQPVPSGAVELRNGSGSWGPNASWSDPAMLRPGGPTSVGFAVEAPGGSPVGTYAIRVQVSFVSNGTEFLLLSRGFFTASTWAAGTNGPNGTSVLNLSRLGVSGVVPETAVLVEPPSPALPLYGILAASIVLAAVGAFYVWRRGPGSISGSVGAPEAINADSALGNSRTSDGD